MTQSMNERLQKHFGFAGPKPVHIAREFTASIVVFLVALPLCMGIAIASGVPPALGLITGIVGGLIVGFIAGSPLQVSGPAAGLAVIVWDMVNTHGLQMLGIIVLLGGLIQLVAGVLKLGQWFRAVSPAVIRGMLAGIGVLIFASQFHVMVDDKPKGGGLENLATIPEALYKGIFPLDGSVHHMAALVGLVTIVSLVLWNTLRPTFLKAIPGALVAVILGSGLAFAAGFEISFVSVPENLIDAANFIPISELGRIADPQILIAALTIATIASAETLLCATAVDQLHDGVRTDYDRELFAQGVGNVICGVFGALPMTGVIVRSSANVDAGATTRISAILHGAWLLAFVAVLPFVLQRIPTSALAAILVFTGYKLMNPKAIWEMYKFNRTETFIFACTVVGIVATDLLTGVLLGIAVALVRLVLKLARLDVELEIDHEAHRTIMHLNGYATFITLPKLAQVLETVPHDHELYVELDGLGYIDHACIELMSSWEKARASMGNTLVLGWEDLFQRYQQGPSPKDISYTGQYPKMDGDGDDVQAA
ncbi:MAG: SulP family inorganic anion transporter [Myxococcota bacterium]